ncbi:unnamed protein product [Penicillium salamii]|uniref:Protein transport protein sec16 n=1 Tax=Penicillium salamii TaxID=1612424 RepID=A0A9W4NDR5_9EURO|nr:unnamed protein product [Penicillium salamii]CAG8178374.1 unnamed protein product [Penicillium salamii]CAG8262104.1 unnamed protein product [Penicillium salamii]CAG8362455.1 unnamed protein product [Penicillium salamii]CAG8366244.1 unnamed protein product [Penicillium salamii]
MAQQSNEADTDAWNPALRPENGHPAETTSATEGGLSDLIAADDSRHKSLADLVSPQSEDFSAWDMSDEVDATPAQYSNMDGLVNNTSPVVAEAQSSDVPIADKTSEPQDTVESVPETATLTEPAEIAPASESPETHIAESTHIAEPTQVAEPESPTPDVHATEVAKDLDDSVPVTESQATSSEPAPSDPITSTLSSEQAVEPESTLVRESTPSTDDQVLEPESKPEHIQDTSISQPSPSKQFFPETTEADGESDDPWASFEQQLSSTLPSTDDGPRNEVQETASEPQPTPSQAPTLNEPASAEEDQPKALEESAVAETPSIEESNGVPPPTDDSAPNGIEPELSSIPQNHPTPANDTPLDTAAVELKTTEDPLSWADESNGGAEAEEADFFNQMNSQTKPIFPEAESRFEEGVPLLDDSAPASPEQPSEPRQSIDNVFANDDKDDAAESFFASGGQAEEKNDGDDFFSSLSKGQTEEEPKAQLTRKSTTQVLESAGFDIESPASDISAAAQFDDLLKGVSSEPPAAKVTEPKAEPTEEELAALWEAELGDSPDDDLAARWEAALDDDDMLMDTEVNQAAPAPAPTQQTPAAPTSALTLGLSSPFQTPQPQSQPRPVPGVYTPHQPSTSDLLGGVPMPGTAPPAAAAMPSYFSQKPANPVATRGESFAEQSKQGYKSPYDLPDDISRPRKPLVTHKPVPPPVNSMPPPLPGSSGMPPPTSGFRPPSVPPPAAAAPPPAPKNFYEELPMPPPRSRPASSGRYTPNPQVAPAAMAPPMAPPMASPMAPPMAAPMSQQPQNPYAAVGSVAPQSPYQPTASAAVPPAQVGYSPAAPPAAQPMGLPVPASLEPPEQLDPYASLASSAPGGPPSISRYSPHPPGSQVSSKPPSSSRYSPAPPSSSGGRNRYASQPLNVPGQNLPFQPRTSSPLAYHEKVSYQPDPSHKPPTLEPAINLSPPRMHPSGSETAPNPYSPQHGSGPINLARRESEGSFIQASPPQGRYAPQEYINEFAQRLAPSSQYAPTPPVANPSLSPPPADPQAAFIRRSQTQSPGREMLSPRALGPPVDTMQRPASVHASGSPTKVTNPYAPVQIPSQNRAVTQHLEFIAPNDGHEQDPLERWKGAPIFKFGFGGSMVSCFPRHTPRYSAGQVAPMIKPTPGETKISQLNEWLPPVDTIVQHPGPLKNKSKKKDLVTWLSSKIAAFENVGVPSFDQGQTDTSKRHDEKTLLWKVVKLLVENDGKLEGSADIQNSLRQAIFPNLPAPDADGSYGSTVASTAFGSANMGSQPDSLDTQWLEEVRLHLISGDREKAVWGAVDRRLWGHAMIIASTMDKSIGKQVAQEFIRREVRSKGANSDSLAALYEIFAGNVEESVDELVPPSARAGLRLISKADGQGATKNATEGLDKWRDTLGLVLNNRSSEDPQALLALGRLLASYGRTEAAHICYIFSRSAVFGGPDDAQANVVLLGADPQRSPSSLLDEDAILLTEAYEYATSVLGNSPVANLPHLLSFKLLNAKCLVDRGRNPEAQAYCDAVASALKATTRPSQYYHQHLFAEVEELSARLRQTTTDSGSWISRPSMEKVSGSMWARFNSFVAGDESDAVSTGSGKGEQAEFGPFANVAGTPTISRSPSVSDIYGSYPGPAAGGQPIPPSGASKYHPSNQYAPTGSPEQFKGRSSMDSQRSNPYFPSAGRRSSQELSPSLDGHMSYGGPIYGSPNASGSGYQPTPPSSSYVPLAPVEEALSPAEAPAAAQPTINGLFYQPPGQPTAPTESPYYQGPPGMPAGGQAPQSPYAPPAATSSYDPTGTGSAYEPIGASSYEPIGGSSYEPVTADPAVNDQHEDNESITEEQPKKKSIMDDDDDDLAARAAAIQKAENDRLAKEAFAKAAEEDGMYQAPRQSQGSLTSFLPAKRGSQSGKKGWFGGWFGGKKEENNTGGGPIKAKLGEESSFYYDKDLKKWVNKKDPGSAAPVRATPPPPRGSAPPSRTASSSSMPPSGAPPMPPMPPMSASGSRPPSSSSAAPLSSSPGISGLAAPPLPRSVSTGVSMPTPPGSSSGPPPRPSSTLTHASSIDDLIGAPTARKGNTVRGKKKGRYVDVMAQ